MGKQTGIRKLSNGRFRARYFAGYDSKGMRQYPAKTFDTQSEAIRWRSDQVAAKNPGRLCETGGLTVSAYLDRWLEMKKQSIRGNSYRMYQQSLDSYVKPLIGTIKLSRLTPSNVEQMQAKLLERVSSSTVASARALLFGALKKAVRLGLIRSNPVEATDGPKRRKPKRYPLTVEEALQFLDACQSSRFGLFFEFALHTGLRPEEIIGLQWSSLELGTRGTVRVNKVIHKVLGGGWEWQEPKTRNSYRPVVFPAELVTKLHEHRKAQLEWKLKAGPHWQHNDLVFTTGLGTPFRHCALHVYFKKILTTAGLPSIVRIYDLRHSFVTFLLLAGVDAKTVSQQAGHASVAFTLDHYGSVLEEMAEGASDRLVGLLRSRTSINRRNQ